MPSFRTNDTEANFHSNLDRLFKLIRNVVDKGQYSNAEAYIKYLFEVLVIYKQRKSKLSNVGLAVENLFVATTETDINSSTSTNTKSLFDNHSLQDYSRGYLEERINELVSEQVVPGKYKLFIFTFDLLKDAIVKLFETEETTKEGITLVREIKFITDRIFFNERNLSNFEKNWFLNQTYCWFVDIYAVNYIDSIEKILALEIEIREVLRMYIEHDKTTLFTNFLESLSTRRFSATFYENDIIQKYQPSIENKDDFRFVKIINEYSEKFRSVQSIKLYRRAVVEFKEEVNALELPSEQKSDFIEDMTIVLFNKFKFKYLNIILAESISYAFLKEKYDFFYLYLKYHNPEDSKSIWLNENYSIQEFREIIPFIEDYDKLMNDKIFWHERHDIDTYINTFLAYYILVADKQEVEEYITTISDYSRISVVCYNLEDIRKRNVIDKLPHNLLNNNNIDISELDRLIDIAKRQQTSVDEDNVKNTPIDDDTKNKFFSDFYREFDNHCVARAIFKFYGNIRDADIEGRNFGMNQLLSRKAFIKQSNTIIVSSHNVLASSLANNESIYIFHKLEQACEKVKLKQSELADFIKDQMTHFDLLISKNSYGVKAYFPTMDFQESWSISDNPLKNIPGFLGILDNRLNVFLLPQSSPKGYILLKSNKMGKLINCIPPKLDNQAAKYNQFRHSFIDFKDRPEEMETLKAKFGEDRLLTEVWIRIFESIDLDLNDFEGISLEVTT